MLIYQKKIYKIMFRFFSYLFALFLLLLVAAERGGQTIVSSFLLDTF